MREQNVRLSQLPFITIVLAAINILVFLYMDFTGDTEDTIYLLEHGAMYVPSVLEDGQWYRVITHMFVHSGIDHIMNNMVMLGAVGYYIEREYGHVRFLTSYFLGGLCATLVSAIPEIIHEEYVVGVGASGAIMAMFAVTLVITFKQRKSHGDNSGTRLAILLALMVFGNMQEGVDWMAHLGGALSGVIMGAVLYRPKRRKTDE